jgi:HEAT repeat protein
MFPLALDERIVRWLAREARGAQREIKERALDRLGLLSDASELLTAGLEDLDPEIRSTAAANLGRVRRADAWPPLVRAARNEPSSDVLCQIVGALAGYRDPMIADVLSELLAGRDRDYRVRMEVVVQLWKYDSVAVRPPLAEIALGDDNGIVRAHAASSLELLDEVAPADPQRHQLWLRLADDDTPGVASAAARALRRENAPLVSNVLEAISRRLQQGATDERAFALYRLAMLAPASAVSLALPLLADVHHEVRIACCACLAAIRDMTTIPNLVAVLRSDPEPRVHVAALLALENYYSTEIGDLLLDLIEAGTVSGDALSIACRQLWKYPSDRTLASLQRVLGSSIKLPHRSVIESTLAFLVRLDAPPAAAST